MLRFGACRGTPQVCGAAPISSFFLVQLEVCHKVFLVRLKSPDLELQYSSLNPQNVSFELE